MANEDMFDRKKGEGGAKMLLNKIWESLYTSILLSKWILGFSTFQLIFFIAMVTCLCVGMEKSVFQGHNSVMVCMTALMDLMSTSVVNILFLYDFIFTYYTGKQTRCQLHCTIFTWVSHDGFYPIVFFRSLYCPSLVLW